MIYHLAVEADLMISGDEVSIAPGLVGGIAKVGFPSVARQARAAVWHKEQDCVVAGLYTCHAFTDFFDNSGCFVARDIGHLAWSHALNS